jgi:hypothetical protein
MWLPGLKFVFTCQARIIHVCLIMELQMLKEQNYTPVYIRGVKN